MKKTRAKKTTSKIDNDVYRICKSALNNELVKVIVFLKGTDRERFNNRLKAAGCRIRYEYDFIDAVAVDVYANLIHEIAGDETVSYIATDLKTTTSLDIARKSVGCAETTLTGKDIGVAVIDTGIFPHADLTAKSMRIIEFVDFVGNRKKPYDDNGHGTHVAGIIAGDGTASNGLYKGIAGNANLIGLKVMDYNGEGSASDILAALQWCLKNKQRYNIKVVSMSLGAAVGDKKIYDPLVIAVEKLWDSGITVVAAAGNSGPALRTIDSPGVSRKIITVGASDDMGTVGYNDDIIAEFSSRGPSPYTKNKPDILAPGVMIMSTSNTGGYAEMSGTSMATPIISGCCALLYEKYQDITPYGVKQKIMKNAHSLKMPSYAQGKGIVNTREMFV